MLYILHGPDRFRAREELDRVRRELDRDGNLRHNTSTLDGKSLTPVDLRAAAHAASFFAESRLVIVDGLQERLRGTRRRGRGRAAAVETMSEADQFIDVLDNLPESTTVVLLDESPPASLIEALGSKAKVLQFPVLKMGELRPWLTARVKAQGGSIAPSALDRLLTLVDGYHLGDLANDVDKLIIYANGRPIEVSDVDLLVSASMQFEFWDLTDAVIEGRTEKALSVFRAMDDKDRPMQVRAFMLVRQFRQLLLAQALLREGLGADQIGQRLGLANYPLRKVIDQASRYPADHLETAYRKLLASDVAVKTGILDVDVALELLIVELCELGRSRGSAGRQRTPQRR